MAKQKKAQISQLHKEPAPPRDEQTIFNDLAALANSPGFAHVIAYFCFRDNFVRYQNVVTPEDMGQLHTGDQLIRTEIDTLIGLLVKGAIDFSIPPPNETQRLIDKAEELLLELHHAMSSVWFKGMTPETLSSGVSPFDSAEALREPIFYGGDSAYDFQYEELSASKYENDADWLKTNKGVDIGIAIRLSHAIASILERKQNETRDAWATQHPDQWTLLPVFTFTIDELCVETGIERPSVEAFVSAFCILPGSNTQFNALNDFNSIVSQPIIRGAGDNLILFQHYSITEAIYEAPFYWMGSDKRYAPAALANRGDFTEKASANFLRRVFGGSVKNNVHLFRSKGEEIGEIDTLVVFGNRALVLQAKSKRLTLEARRGNDQQIRDDFKKAIQESYEQALICSKALIEGTCKIVDDDGNEFVLSEPIDRAYPICIVADHYPALAAQSRQFLKVEDLEKIAPPLVTDIFALDAITEMLRSPLFFVSYLDLRAMHGKKIFATHELVLLSTHLKRNLWINKDLSMVTFDEGMSVDVDVAMLLAGEACLARRRRKEFLPVIRERL